MSHSPPMTKPLLLSKGKQAQEPGGCRPYSEAAPTATARQRSPGGVEPTAVPNLCACPCVVPTAVPPPYVRASMRLCRTYVRASLWLCRHPAAVSSLRLCRASLRLCRPYGCAYSEAARGCRPCGYAATLCACFPAPVSNLCACRPYGCVVPAKGAGKHKAR